MISSVSGTSSRRDLRSEWLMARDGHARKLVDNTLRYAGGVHEVGIRTSGENQGQRREVRQLGFGGVRPIFGGAIDEVRVGAGRLAPRVIGQVGLGPRGAP